ncbi:MAG: hypothetical protein WAM10_16935, partial [Methylocella sp.]
DEEGARSAPPIPPAKHGGNQRAGIMRKGVNAPIAVRPGCRWRAIAKDVAARHTVKDDVIRWNHHGTRDRIHPARAAKCREPPQRHTRETAGSVRSAPLNTRKPASLHEAFSAAEARRLVDRFEWHYSPKHDRWPASP